MKKSCIELKLQKRVSQLESEVQRLHHQNQITINTINNTVNNIHINAYGNEDLQPIMDKVPILLNYFPTTAVTDLICERYYDPAHPENKTVKIASRKEKWAQVYNGQKWEHKNKLDVLFDVLQKNYELLEEYYEAGNIRIPEYKKISWQEIRNLWHNETFPDKEMLSTTEEILMNQNLTRSSYRDVFEKKK